MDCTHCGGSVVEKDQFCGTCGNNLLGSNREAPSETEAPDLLKAFVGEYKESYYFGKWAKNERRSWNWAAFFATFFWLGYRKMYTHVLVILLFFITADVIHYLVGAATNRFDSYVGLGIAAALGIGGNFEYKKFAQREINKLEKRFSGDELLEKVRKRGDSSWKGFWLTLLLFIGYVGISAVLESVVYSYTEGESNVELTTYTSEDYGISFDYPISWNNFIEISHGTWESNSEATIDVSYLNHSKEIEQYVFSIIMYGEVLEEGYWENSDEIYITNDGEKTYTMAIADEANEEMHDPLNQEDLDFVSTMILELDFVVDSFRFE
ncbi:DUF2628 domain-containing protein [Sporosarcina sp. E16_8]|uniref:DUF2628 domain-containing protein n=1 Tax=Sporosarcina sp. E16_8 TaxID=2789295 RepID=UPI002103BF12|nr:DUF2628 domain-containing protein [Sporosarcina sp. E16_8]